MQVTKQPSQTILSWLKDNLGKGCTASLTGTDTRALRAGVQILELYSQCDESHENTCIRAFACVVSQMQKSTMELAYHSIAHVLDWSNRGEIWEKSRDFISTLPPATQILTRRCQYEPHARAASLT